MAVVIDEMLAQVEPSQGQEGGGEAEARPADEKQSMIDMLELIQERKARLVVD